MPIFAVGLVLASTVLHASWNLLLGARRDSFILLRITLIVVAIGIVPAVAVELTGTPFSLTVWLYALAAGIAMAVYDLGLTKGYQLGNFTVVYPVARALPILIVAVADVVIGQAPTLIAWAGMVLVLVGCVVMPLESLRAFKLSAYLNRTMIWIIVTALGTVGYTLIDHTAADFFEAGPMTAARYGIYEFAFSALFFTIILRVIQPPVNTDTGWRHWWQAVLGALAMFGAYWLVLWSYQISPQASYVVALRQFSIVLGVIVGSFLFNEPARGLRISASIAIAGGIGLITLGG